MPGAFSASPIFDYDEAKTLAAIRQAGWQCERWIDRTALQLELKDIRWPLIQKIHRQWFVSTFPEAAGVQRAVEVQNRKGTAVAVGAITESVETACGNWLWRQENNTPSDGIEQIEFAVSEANELVVRIYDIHPFLDGNTRTTFSLRNLLLIRAGLYALQEVTVDPFMDAWWNAKPGDHDRLDELVTEELIKQDLRREQHNRILHVAD